MWWIIYSHAGTGIAKKTEQEIDRIRRRLYVSDIRGPFTSEFEAFMTMAGYYQEYMG